MVPNLIPGAELETIGPVPGPPLETLAAHFRTPGVALPIALGVIPFDATDASMFDHTALVNVPPFNAALL